MKLPRKKPKNLQNVPNAETVTNTADPALEMNGAGGTNEPIFETEMISDVADLQLSSAGTAQAPESFIVAEDKDPLELTGKDIPDVTDNANDADNSQATLVMPSTALAHAAQDATSKTSHLNERPALPAPDDDNEIDAYRRLEERRRKKRRKKIIVAGAIAGAVVVIALAAFALRAFNSQEDEIPLTTYPIVQEDFQSYITSSGSIRPASTVLITPEVDGIVSEIHIAVGDHVDAGQTVVSLKNDELDQTVTQAAQNVRSAQNAVSSAEVAVDNAWSAYSAAWSINEGVQEAKLAYDSACIDLDNAQIALNTAIEQRDQAQATANKRTVTSPAAGTVIAIGAQVGAAAGSGYSSGSGGATSSALATVADLSRMRITVQVNEVDVNNVTTGQKAEVTFSALPDVTLEATVENIAVVATGSNEDLSAGGGIVTYAVEMLVPNPDPAVRPGMTANVKIITTDIPDALTIPISALIDNGDGTYAVEVVTEYDEDGNPITEIKPVEVAGRNSASAAITGDIKVDDEVVDAGMGSGDGDDFDVYDSAAMTEAEG